MAVHASNVQNGKQILFVSMITFSWCQINVPACLKELSHNYIYYTFKLLTFKRKFWDFTHRIREKFQRLEKYKSTRADKIFLYHWNRSISKESTFSKESTNIWYWLLWRCSNIVINLLCIIICFYKSALIW